MNPSLRSVLAALSGLLLGCCTTPTSSLAAGLRWIDLSHDFAADTIYWPTAPGFELVEDSKGLTPGGWWYESNTIRTSEHGGTHLDAPVHFAKGAYTTDQIPVSQLVGPACVVDVKAACQQDPDH